MLQLIIILSFISIVRITFKVLKILEKFLCNTKLILFYAQISESNLKKDLLDGLSLSLFEKFYDMNNEAKSFHE